MTAADLTAKLQKLNIASPLSFKGELLLDVLVDSKGELTLVTDAGPDDDPPEPVRRKCPSCNGAGYFS